MPKRKGRVHLFVLAAAAKGRRVCERKTPATLEPTKLLPCSSVSHDLRSPEEGHYGADKLSARKSVAALVAFVARPESSYFTGAILTVDGGTNA